MSRSRYPSTRARPGVLDTDDLTRLLVEVCLGVPVERSTLPDTQLVRATRARLVDQVAEIRANGGDIDIPAA
jgi:hypothetical protein